MTSTSSSIESVLEWTPFRSLDNSCRSALSLEGPVASHPCTQVSVFRLYLLWPTTAFYPVGQPRLEILATTPLYPCWFPSSSARMSNICVASFSFPIQPLRILSWPSLSLCALAKFHPVPKAAISSAMIPSHSALAHIFLKDTSRLILLLPSTTPFLSILLS